jgi:hypothetical protein
MYTLPIVHLVDTEGPFSEPIEETFKQLNDIFHIDVEPTEENLQRIQSGIGIPDDIKEEVMLRFSKHRLGYNKTWSDIENMCITLFSKEWRNTISGNSPTPYTISWNCLDQIGFHDNPRRRQLGPNLIYQFYNDQINSSGIYWDRLYWHYHPMSFNKALNKTGTSLNHYPHHYASLCHRVLDCHSFPAVFRPGYHIERTDLNVFLEQWIPFDYANQNALDQRKDENYRFQDWRKAPTEWSVYHPDFSDPRRPGNLKRAVARCLNIGTDFAKLTKDEIHKAFQRCSEGKPTILAYCNHDHRDMIAEIEEVTSLIHDVSTHYESQVQYQYCNAVDAMRMYFDFPNEEPVEFSFTFNDGRLDIKCSKPIFGAQPFLTFRTFDNTLYHDNFCFGEDELSFFYQFDTHSMPIQMIQEIGVATNDLYGSSSVLIIDVQNPDHVIRKYIS